MGCSHHCPRSGQSPRGPFGLERWYLRPGKTGVENHRLTEELSVDLSQTPSPDTGNKFSRSEFVSEEAENAEHPDTLETFLVNSSVSLIQSGTCPGPLCPCLARGGGLARPLHHPAVRQRCKLLLGSEHRSWVLQRSIYGVRCPGLRPLTTSLC